MPHEYWLKRGDTRDAPAPETGLFYVQDIRVEGYKAGRPVIVVTSMGIAFADGKDYKIECSSGLSEDFSMITAGYSTIWRKGYPRVTKLWVSNSTPGVMAHVGVSSVPPETFGLPATPWIISIVSDTNWSAIGWIGESRVPQKLVGCDACLVTDTWIYDLGYSDRDGVPAGIIYL